MRNGDGGLFIPQGQICVFARAADYEPEYRSEVWETVFTGNKMTGFCIGIF